MDPKKVVHFNNGNGVEEHIPFDKINFHPVLKDIEYIFWMFMLSNKALSLPETQRELKNDDVFSGMINKYNNWTNLKTGIKENGKVYLTTLNAQDQLIFFGKSMAILTFDWPIVPYLTKG